MRKRVIYIVLTVLTCSAVIGALLFVGSDSLETRTKASAAPVLSDSVTAAVSEPSRQYGSVGPSPSPSLTPPSGYQSRMPSAPVLLLPFEHRLIDADGISIPDAKSLLESPNFEDQYRQMLRQSQSDFESSRMTDYYDMQLRDGLSVEADTTFNGIACGLSLCVGSVSVHGLAGAEALSNLHGFFGLDSETPAFSMIEFDVGEQADVHERRFIFSLDPAIRSINDRGAANSPDRPRQ